MNEYIPWSDAAFQTQEEHLLVETRAASFRIGIPKERTMDEHRVLLTPDTVQLLIQQGHEILIESGAGQLAGFTDKMYADAGAQLVSQPQEIYQCHLICKVAPPTEEEISWMSGHQTLISALQLRTRKRSYFKALADKKVTALALEEVRNSDDQSALRIAMSEIAGQMAARMGASLLAEGAHGPGKGKLMGPIPGVAPAQVVVIGAGTAGLSAVRAFQGMGASVVLMDPNINKLRYAQEVVTNTLVTEVIQEVALQRRINEADVLVGALPPVNGRTPIVVTEDMVAAMSPNSVVIDISIDHGGCVETSELTSHQHPTRKVFDVIHYAVPNMASAVGHTASIAMSNFVGPMLSSISSAGGIEDCLHYDLNTRAGLYMYGGLLTKRHLGEHFDLPFSNDSLLFGTL